MKKILLIIALFYITSIISFAQVKENKNRDSYVKLTVPEYGYCIIRLYSQTPNHRDNFLKLINKNFYDSLLFHRVIKNFMIQGGDPNSRNAKPGSQLGMGDIGYTVPAEFHKDLFHRKGALAAARDNNPQKASSGCQFYIVQGRVLSDNELNSIESSKGIKIPENQRNIYKTIGGTPFLDGDYTVFGQVIEGIPMLDKIASIKTDVNDRPLKDVRMIIKELSKQEVKELKKRLKI